MGNHASEEAHEAHAGLFRVCRHASSRAGMIAVHARYHNLPKAIEDDYIVGKTVLGTGYNGSVYMAKSRTTGGSYAVKGFGLIGVSRTKLKELQAECEIFLAMDHPHVARLVDVYESNAHLYLVMECMQGGELFDRIRHVKRFTPLDVSKAVLQMLKAVNYLHLHGVVHRDLKLENFMYDKLDSDFLKLIDFGFSKNWESSTKMKLGCGTLAYVAPEVLQESYTSKCDLWSLGVVVFILLCGHMPFNGNEAHQIKNIKRGKITKKAAWSSLPSDARDFVTALLTVDPEERLSAEDALKHPFILEVDERLEVDTGIVQSLVGFHHATRFRRASLEVMAWSLSNDERAAVRDAFEQIDTLNQGTITIGELKEVLNRKFEVTDEELRPIFESLDASHDHEIHYSEFLAAMLSTRIEMHDDLLHSTFHRFDVDNTGYITRDNLQAVLGETFGGADIKQLMLEVDTSHDGQISYQEFIRYMKDGGATDFHAQCADKLIDTAMEGRGPSKERALKTKQTGDLWISENPKENRKSDGSKRSRMCMLGCELPEGSFTRWIENMTPRRG